MQERKVGRKYLWQVFGWREERRKYQLDPGIFSLTSPKCFLPKMGEKIERKTLTIWSRQKYPCARTHGFVVSLPILAFFFLWLLKKRILSFCFAFLFLLLCLFDFFFGFFFFGTSHYFIIIIIFGAHLPLTCAPLKKN